MSKIAVETAAVGSLTSYVYPGAYNSAQLGLGPLMVQVNESGNEGKWVGPVSVELGRPVEVGLSLIHI